MLLMFRKSDLIKIFFFFQAHKQFYQLHKSIILILFFRKSKIWNSVEILKSINPENGTGMQEVQLNEYSKSDFPIEQHLP